jgi:endonuclease/exonuclease/phosphatase (EEP) superfamily protein YafD
VWKSRVVKIDYSLVNQYSKQLTEIFIVFKKIIRFTFFMFLVLIGFTYLLPTNPYSELLSHFTWFFFYISLIYTIIYICIPNKKFLALAMCGCALTAYPLLSSLEINHIPRKEPAPVEDISVLQCNIHYINKNPSLLCQSIQEQAYPEIVVIQEVTPEILETLTSHLNEVYPFRFEAPEWGAYGMVIFSKLPIVKAKRQTFQKSPNKYTILQLVTSQEKIPFTLIELHATSPVRDPENQRKQELEELIAIIAQTHHEHKILIGDLNTTPYSPYFQKMQKSLNFKNAIGGPTIQETWERSPLKSDLEKIPEAWKGLDIFGNFQFQGTWPSYAPFFLRIPLDHLLHSKTMRVMSRSVLPYVGSDHLPVLTRIRLYGNPWAL